RRTRCGSPARPAAPFPSTTCASRSRSFGAPPTSTRPWAASASRRTHLPGAPRRTLLTHPNDHRPQVWTACRRTHGILDRPQEGREGPHRRVRRPRRDGDRAHPRGAEQAQFEALCEIELARMRQMNAYIALRGSDNIFEAADVPSSRVQLISRIMKPVIDQRVNKTKWVVLRWPTPAMAQQAAMSTEAFEEFYFKVCTLNYARMKPGMKELAQLMRRTDQVRVTGPGTDLRFSIKGIGARECGGQYNIPDGEVFSCPVRDSVEGFVQYNAASVYLGQQFDNIRLAFRKGRIVGPPPNTPRRLSESLDSAAGARLVGEFAIGFNPHILEPMRDILFDEKIAGSFRSEERR